MLCVHTLFIGNFLNHVNITVNKKKSKFTINCTPLVMDICNQNTKNVNVTCFIHDENFL